MLVFLVLSGCTYAAALSSGELAIRRAEAHRITKTCDLPAGTIIVKQDGSVHLRPKKTESYERVDCALAELRKSKVIPNAPMEFVGNELPDENKR